MNKHIIAFASVTHANKAKAVFSKYGIKSVIGKTPGNLFRGCGYSVTAEADITTLVKIMEKNGISYRSVSEAKK